ncbi:GNAT family N-acetyltransferase [Vibrio sp. 99-70-13A1]|uniref:tRNA(Met) cytidine acetyltransferase TmcA n=1 Tax=Vibrio sp. 99-70-13A1 TaxID=2607601 RepID=UPI001493C2C7|nr:GNAT family N-acetyltransferase [Vibrio sp. 99-70-13A1]NOH95924.1 tRNA(Met) cytidine acetyltransferase [Vibrio sp. 99-70-13A1]
MTTQPLNFLTDLSSIAQHNDHRYGVVLRGCDIWQDNVIQTYLAQYPELNVFQIGGVSREGVNHVSINKGQQLLGRECQLLICDFRFEFDANSFSAALGSIIGGGLAIILPPEKQKKPSIDQSWLTQHFDKLLQLDEKHPPSDLPKKSITAKIADKFSQQNHAIELILKVVSGHRKRPLVLTADRGRGKSSALGIATAQLLLMRSPFNVVVTASSIKAVEPIFYHALNLLKGAEREGKGTLKFGQSRVTFIAPDELLQSKPDCDLLLVDEAAAIPIPMLKKMVESYHRLVFSTTLHGYEGSGRGFGIKFESWLSKVRPNWKACTIEQPIRWSVNDPLENWLFDCFLLNVDFTQDKPVAGRANHTRLEDQAVGRSLDPFSIRENNSDNLLGSETLLWEKLPKEDFVTHPEKLKQCFALLVSAHYQTSPNDLMQILSNASVELYALFHENTCLGCILTVEEGGLSSEVIQDIQLGKRRPKGHLAPAVLANHLGFAESASSRCIRIMRIATHPRYQNQGLGSLMLDNLSSSLSDVDYFATSYGATSELVSFWKNNGYSPVHLGHQRDQASGCHSLLMLKPIQSNSQHWIGDAVHGFEQNFLYLASSSLASLEPLMVKALLPKSLGLSLSASEVRLLEHYVHGGNSFDSVGYLLVKVALYLNSNGKGEFSLLLIAKAIQQKTWSECVSDYGFVGRKQAESQIRLDVKNILCNLQCK